MNRVLGLTLTLAGAALMIMAIIESRKKSDVAHLGSFHIIKDEKAENNWMPYTGGVLFIGGIVLLVTSKRPR
jgi:hypothetical protein